MPFTPSVVTQQSSLKQSVWSAAQYTRAVLKLLRLHHWIKNFLVFVPVIFSSNFSHWEKNLQSIMAFFAFSFVASSVYILNDCVDAHLDRNHPVKRFRPLASRAIGFPFALFLFVILLSAGFFGSYFLLNPLVTVALIVYFCLNLLYSTVLKKYPPLDILTVGLFYLLRPFVGALAIGVFVSNWLIITTYCAALYLVTMKRASEVALWEQHGKKTRIALGAQTFHTLEMQAVMSMTIALVSYFLYASSFTGPFVFTAIPLIGLAFRLMLLKEKAIEKFETPEKLIFQDPTAALLFGLWGIGVLVYHFR